MTSRFVLPISDVGAGITPSSGALLYFYETGTTTPKNTYSDSAGTIPNANPVVANSLGQFPDIFIIGTYKVVLKSSAGVQYWSADPVDEYLISSDLSAFGGSLLTTIVNSTTIQLGESYTITDRGYGVFDVVLASGVTPNTFNIVQCIGVPTLALVLRVGNDVNVKQFGAVLDGVSDDSVATQTAIDYAYSIQRNTALLYSIGKPIAQPSYGAAFVDVVINDATCLLANPINIPENIRLVGKNASIVIGVDAAISVAEQNNTIDGFYIYSTQITPSYKAIDINIDRSTYSVDIPRVIISNCMFKNLADCFTHNANIVNGFSILDVYNCHFINCLQVSSRIRSDRAVIDKCSIYGMFSGADVPVVKNEGSGLSVKDSVFVPFPYVTAPLSITNARWFDHHGGVILIEGCRFGNEDLNAGINPVTTYRDAENVTIVYNHAEYQLNNTAGGDFFENAEISSVILRDNHIYHRNSSAVRLFKAPNRITIRGNVGVSGAVFDANLDITRKDYLISLDASFVAPSKSALRTLIRISIDTPSNFMHLIDTGSSYATSLWESVQYDDYSTRYFLPDSVSGSTATFTIDVSKLPAAHIGTIKFYGRPRSGSSAVSMGKIDYKSRVYYDTTGLIDNKQLLTIATDFTRADEGGSVVYDTPGISLLQWGGGTATTTLIERDDLRLAVTNTGVSGDIESCYAVLEGNPIQSGMHS